MTRAGWSPTATLPAAGRGGPDPTALSDDGRPHRVALGFAADGTLLRAPPLRPVLVVGPQRSRKTTGVIIPAVLEWDGPVVVTFVRRDVVDATAGRRAELGRVLVFDPSADRGVAAPAEPVGLDPLSGVASLDDAARVAAEVVAAAEFSDRDTFWANFAAALLGPLLLAAARTGAGMDTVVRWARPPQGEEPWRLLRDAGEGAAVDAVQGWAHGDSRTVQSAWACAAVALAPWSTPGVQASAARGGLDPAGLLTGRDALYLVAPPDSQRLLAPLFAMVVRRVLAAAWAAEAAGRKPARPLLLALDEAANVAPLPDLATLATTAAGTGVQLVTVFHDLSQLRARYGEWAATIAANHSALLVLARPARPRDAAPARRPHRRRPAPRRPRPRRRPPARARLRAAGLRAPPRRAGAARSSVDDPGLVDLAGPFPGPAVGGRS